MIGRLRLVLLVLGLVLGWLATPFAPAMDSAFADHGGTVVASAEPAEPCRDHHAAPCPPAPRHAEGGAICATPAGCPVLVAIAPALPRARTVTPHPLAPPPRLALPDGRAVPPEPPPPRLG